VLLSAPPFSFRDIQIKFQKWFRHAHGKLQHLQSIIGSVVVPRMSVRSGKHVTTGPGAFRRRRGYHASAGALLLFGRSWARPCFRLEPGSEDRNFIHHGRPVNDLLNVLSLLRPLVSALGRQRRISPLARSWRLYFMSGPSVPHMEDQPLLNWSRFRWSSCPPRTATTQQTGS